MLKLLIYLIIDCRCDVVNIKYIIVDFFAEFKISLVFYENWEL